MNKKIYYFALNKKNIIFIITLKFIYFEHCFEYYKYFHTSLTLDVENIMN